MNRLHPRRASPALAFTFVLVSTAHALTPNRVSIGGLGDLVTQIAGGEGVGISAVSPAGDVDGDGLSDVILRFSPRPGFLGAVDRVVLLYGFRTPGGLLDLFSPTLRKTVIETPRTEPHTELSDRDQTGVAGGRDVNGDGRPDLLVASPYEGRVGRAAVLLILGGPLPDQIGGDQVGEELPGSFLVDRESRSTYLGKAVELSEDLNGDGLAEMVVIDPTFSTGRGRVFVIFGSPAPPLVIDVAKVGETVPGFVFQGTNDRTVSHVASLGDVDGDGLSELGVTLTSGTSFLLFGRPDFPAAITAAEFPGAHGLLLPELKDIQGAGDTDGDGYADVLLDRKGSGGVGPGQAYLLAGGPRARLPQRIDPEVFAQQSLGSVIVEPFDIGAAGGSGSQTPRFSFARGKDIDGDGKVETLLAVSNAHVEAGPAVAAFGGRLYPMRGGSILPEQLETREIAMGLGVRIDGAEPQGRLGRLAFLLDDFDGDGVGELLLTSAFEACEHPLSVIDYKLWLVSGRILAPSLEPRLGSLYPDSGSTGGADSVLFLGAGFGDAPRVFFGEREALSVEVLGSGVLVAEAPPAEFPSTVMARVEPRPGESTNAIPYRYALGRTVRVGPDEGPSMEIRHEEVAPLSARGAVTGDFNGDSRTDLALVARQL